MKRHDTINFAILGVIILLVLWGALRGPLSTEGVRFIAKAAVVLYLMTVATIFKRLVGPGQRRGQIMLAGTLGGFAAGVLAAYPMNSWLDTETSVVCVCVGLTVGWAMAWRFARQIPRETAERASSAMR
jgi:hypothetical protein